MGSLSKVLLLNMAYLAAAILELSQDQPPQSAHDALLGVELGHVFEVDQVEAENRGYTGVFATGADSMVIRYSLAGLYVKDISSMTNPSVAFKMLRNEVPSGN